MNCVLTDKENQARERVCLALDVPTVEEALQLASELSDLVGSMKVGKELHTAAGNEGVNIVRGIADRGGMSFLDLKLHDTPQTVYGAALQCAVPGVYMFNLHVAANEEACKKAVEASYESAARFGIARPKVIGVTVLTSINDGDLNVQGLGITYDDLVRRRTGLAKQWGLDGIVCPAKKAGALEKEFGAWSYVTPGIAWKGRQGMGQKQLYTPDLAVQDCKSSILVIGSAVTKAEDRRAAAYEILQAMAQNL